MVDTLDSIGYVKFNYTVTDRNTGEKTDYDYKVQLTTTPCNLGGVRYWFICPLSKNGVYCGRRVAKLYVRRVRITMVVDIAIICRMKAGMNHGMENLAFLELF